MVCFVVFRYSIGCPFSRIKCLSFLLCFPTKGAALGVRSNVPVPALPTFNNTQAAAHAGRSVATPAVRRSNVQPPNLQVGDTISVNDSRLNGEFIVTEVGGITENSYVRFFDHSGYVLNNCGHIFLLNKPDQWCYSPLVNITLQSE